MHRVPAANAAFMPTLAFVPKQADRVVGLHDPQLTGGVIETGAPGVSFAEMAAARHLIATNNPVPEA